MGQTQLALAYNVPNERRAFSWVGEEVPHVAGHALKGLLEPLGLVLLLDADGGNVLNLVDEDLLDPPGKGAVAKSSVPLVSLVFSCAK